MATIVELDVRNPSGLHARPAATRPWRVAIATCSSPPSQRSRIRWPRSTPRPRTAMMLLAVTSGLSVVRFVTRISLLKPAAAFTNTAAGRACSPDGLRISISSARMRYLRGALATPPAASAVIAYNCTNVLDIA